MTRDISALHPDLQPLCMEFMIRCKAENIPVFITETWRDTQRQRELWIKGRDSFGKIIKQSAVVTYSKPGTSKHEFTITGKPASKAFDVGLKNADGSADWDDTNPHWFRMGEIGEELGLTWGGHFKRPDKPHFQIT